MSDQRKFIQRWTNEGFEFHTGKNHPYLYRADTGRITMPKTPSDHRSMKNTEMQIKRKIRTASTASRP
jgi:hypothetical protein